MRIYIIGNDGITLCREPPTAVNAGEIAVASDEELHAAAQRQAAADPVECSAGRRETAEGWRPRRAARSSCHRQSHFLK